MPNNTNSSSKKKRKFQIEPNSLSDTEEKAVKSVLQLFRNRGDEKIVDGGKETNEPSTNDILSRPLKENVAVHNFNSPPSTFIEISRPLFEELPSTTESGGRSQSEIPPSTPEIVDGLPSTTPPPEPLVDGLPSTEKKTAVHKYKKLPSTKPSANDRHNKFLARFDNRVNPDIKRRIDIFCANFDLSQREFVEQSAVHFIDVWTAKLGRNVDGKTALDDRLKMMMWKTEIRVINLYRAYNFENKWKIKDDEAAREFNLTDIRLIELGIIETQFNSQFKKINSFGYYQNEIEKFIEQKLGTEMLEFLLKHYREKWVKATGRELDLKFLEDD